MEWRYIPFRRYDPHFKVGLNQALIESVGKGNDPVVFLSGWSTNCVNIGYSQNIEQEVDLEELEKRDDVVVVRRQGGGGATYLTENGEITWGMVAPAVCFPDDVNRIYEDVCGGIAEGLKQVGIDAEHEPVNDIVTDEGKISGATVKKKENEVYVGGTLLYEVDPEEMFSLLTPSEDKKKDKQIEDYRERVSSIKRESNASFKETRKALKRSLLDSRDYRETELREDELYRAEELANKYRSEEWIYRNGGF